MTPSGDQASARDFWERRYAGGPPAEAPRPNARLVEIATLLSPGDALDLGCGGGGDTLWLAERGWQVTAVDLAEAAVHRVTALAAEHRLQDRVTAIQQDLTTGFPHGSFDLVSAHYLHSPYDLLRTQTLRAAAHALRAGGWLVVVDHGSTMPGAPPQAAGPPHPTPTEVAEELALDSEEWQVLRVDRSTRVAEGPDGQVATVLDHVLVIERRR